MKKLHKIGLASFAIALEAIVLSSCTANFCSVKEKSRLLFAVEPGVSRYYDSEEAANAAKKEGDNYTYVLNEITEYNVWQLIEKDGSSYTKSSQINTIISSAQKSNFVVPSDEYFARLDKEVLKLAVNTAKTIETDKAAEGYFDTLTKEKVDRILTDYGYARPFQTDARPDRVPCDLSRRDRLHGRKGGGVSQKP